jgi:hypothetical protein
LCIILFPLRETLQPIGFKPGTWHQSGSPLFAGGAIDPVGGRHSLLGDCCLLAALVNERGNEFWQRKAPPTRSLGQAASDLFALFDTQV